jgi:hypothetical protein
MMNEEHGGLTGAGTLRWARKYPQFPEGRGMTGQYTVARAEERVAMKVTALLVERHGKLVVETGITENVSSRGARVISKSEWLLEDRILLALPGFRFTSAARVAYCDALGDGRFGIGLEFVAASEHVDIAALGAALEFRRPSGQ